MAQLLMYIIRIIISVVKFRGVAGSELLLLILYPKQIRGAQLSLILGTPKAHSRVYKNSQFVSIMSQNSETHNHSSNLFRIHSKIIFPPKPKSSMWSLSLIFLRQKSANILTYLLTHSIVQSPS